MIVEHTTYVCPGNHDHSHCMFCDGGLFACSICGSFEGATTTECPGREMTIEERDAVYAGDLDYINSQWANTPSLHTPNGRAKAATT